MEEVLNQNSKPFRHLINGVAHSIQYDNNYKILLDFWTLVNILNKAILKPMIKKYSKNSDKSEQMTENQTRFYHLLKVIPEAIKQEFIARSLNGWTINTLWSAFGLHKPAIRGILNSMERQKMIEKLGKNYHKYPYRITDSHFFEVKVFLDSNKWNKITILRLRQRLENSTHLNVLSSTGVRYILKHILKHTYKRVTSLHSKSLSAERIRLFWETIYIQKFLATAGYKLIWVDEFHSNMSHIRGYNWSQRGV